MAARKPLVRNNHLEEAMVLLIGNQAAFVEQMARSDRELVELKRRGDESFARIEQRFSRIEDILIQHTTILEQLPEAIRQKIGFNSPKQN